MNKPWQSVSARSVLLEPLQFMSEPNSLDLRKTVLNERSETLSKQPLHHYKPVCVPTVVSRGATAEWKWEQDVHVQARSHSAPGV